MNNDEAKFILRAYRPGGQDAADPQFTEALAQARRDPELARWLAEQTALDTVIGGKIQSVPVPADLKASILAARNIVPLRQRSWWQRSIHPVAAAASLAVTFATVGYLALHEPPEPTADLARFTQDITDYLGKGYGVLPRHAHLATTDASYFGSQSYRMNYRSPNLDDIRQWLAANGGHGEFVSPTGLKKPLNLGCGVMDWRGRRITLIAFQTGRTLPQDKVHLVIINSSDLPDPPARGQPRFNEGGDWTTVAWSDGSLTYFLLAPGDRQAVGKYL
ncbi:MAG: hypothetical protein ABMA26_20660 [Limisphaerales bacterium]